MRRLLPFVALLIVAPLTAQTPDDKKASVTYLQKLQQADGGFPPLAPDAKAPAPKAGLRSTSSALRALGYFGGAPKSADALPRFVEEHFDKSTGGFIDIPGGKPDVFTTAVGLMVVNHLKLPEATYVEPAVKYLAANAKGFEEIRIAAAGLEAVNKRPAVADAWLEEIATLRNPDGTYGKGPGTARATGGAVAAVLRLGGKVEQRDNVVKALKAGQRADGGFGKEEAQASDLETTYRVLRAFMMLKEKPDEAKLRAYIGKCRNADGGYGVAPGQSSTVPGTYYASIMLHWLDPK